MIGLTADEWDVIMGGLEAFEMAEYSAIAKGCECIDECDPLTIDKGCYDETQIKIIRTLLEKIHVIHKTMEYLERELRK